MPQRARRRRPGDSGTRHAIPAAARGQFAEHAWDRATTEDAGVDRRGLPAGAIVLGDAHDYVPPADLPRLYVQVLLTAAARLIEHAVAVGRKRRAEQLRVDCWDGVPALAEQYERLGFLRVGSFEVGDWIVVRAL
jgi:hypothetical protein